MEPEAPRKESLHGSSETTNQDGSDFAKKSEARLEAVACVSDRSLTAYKTLSSSFPSSISNRQPHHHERLWLV